MRCRQQSGQSRVMRMGATVEKRQLFVIGTNLGGDFSRHILQLEYHAASFTYDALIELDTL